MKASTISLIAVIVLIFVNILILYLYRQYLEVKRRHEIDDVEFNSNSLFRNTSAGGFMLRLPIPVFSEIKDDRLQRILKLHNRLVYWNYVILAFSIWHSTMIIRKL